MNFDKKFKLKFKILPKNDFLNFQLYFFELSTTLNFLQLQLPRSILPPSTVNVRMWRDEMDSILLDKLGGFLSVQNFLQLQLPISFLPPSTVNVNMWQDEMGSILPRNLIGSIRFICSLEKNSNQYTVCNIIICRPQRKMTSMEEDL